MPVYNKSFLGDGYNNNVYCENGPNADFIWVILPVSHLPTHDTRHLHSLSTLKSHTFPSKRFLSLFSTQTHAQKQPGSLMWLRQRNQEAKPILIFSLSFRLLWFIFLTASKVSWIHCWAPRLADLLARPLNLCLSYFHSDPTNVKHTRGRTDCKNTHTYTEMHTTRRVKNMGIQ